MVKALSGQIATRTLSGRLVQLIKSGGQTDSDHRIVTIGSYNFVAVSVETIETEEE